MANINIQRLIKSYGGPSKLELKLNVAFELVTAII